MGGKKVTVNIGDVYNRLTVIGEGAYNHSLCRCLCGNEKEILNSRLRRSKSCGKCPKKWLVGQKFGKLTVVSFTGKKMGTNSIWRCSCECGGTKEVPVGYLTSGDTKSCGCQLHLGTPKDITGKKLNKLTAVKCTGSKCENGDYIWLFSCDCGNYLETTIGRFNSEHTKSCGCLLGETLRAKDNAHGMKHTQTYKSWCKMKERCYNEKDILYSSYGGSGISVCDQWKGSFKQFYIDMGESPKGFTIDRINTKGNYEPNNCRWASSYVQARNQRGKKDTSSIYKGVQLDKESGKWLVSITLGSYIGKKVGRYVDEYHSAQVYNMISEEIFGKGCTFLELNDVSDDYSNIVRKGKFFSYWLPLMIEEKKRLYEQE